MNLVEVKSNPGGTQAVMPSTSMGKMERVMEWRKRRLEDDDAANEIKRSRMNVYFRLESESSIASDNDTESIYSIQDKETDVVQDTSDTDTKSNLSDSDLEVELEYEVASLASSEDIFLDDCSSSGTEDFHASAGAIAAVLCDSSLEKWITDGESSDNSSTDDANTSLMDARKDFWTCIRCKSVNNNPYFRYCQKCFQVRKTFFPPRPRGNRKRRRGQRKDVQPKVKLDTLQSCLNRLNQDSNQPSLSQDSGLGSSQEITKLDFNQIVVPAHLKRTLSQEDIFEEPPCKVRKIEVEDEDERKHEHEVVSSEVGEDREVGNKKDEFLEEKILDGHKSDGISSNINSASDSDSKSFSTVINLNVDGNRREDDADKGGCFSSHSSGVEKPSFDESKKDELCIICNSLPKDGIFLHGSIGHMCCCYKCAVKTWRTNKRCPVCNCKVKNVVKLFTV